MSSGSPTVRAPEPSRTSSACLIRTFGHHPDHRLAISISRGLDILSAEQGRVADDIVAFHTFTFAIACSRLSISMVFVRDDDDHQYAMHFCPLRQKW